MLMVYRVLIWAFFSEYGEPASQFALFSLYMAEINQPLFYALIKAAVHMCAGPAPAENYQGHRFTGTSLCLGESGDLQNIGRYSARVRLPSS